MVGVAIRVFYRLNMVALCTYVQAIRCRRCRTQAVAPWSLVMQASNVVVAEEEDIRSCGAGAKTSRFAVELYLCLTPMVVDQKAELHML
jgi:hypothetical protein